MPGNILEMIFYSRCLRALRITWLEPNYPNLRKVKDVNHVRKELAWSVILRVLLRHLLQNYAKKLLNSERSLKL